MFTAPGLRTNMFRWFGNGRKVPGKHGTRITSKFAHGFRPVSIHGSHVERSRDIPVADPFGYFTGFLDFARNDVYEMASRSTMFGNNLMKVEIFTLCDAATTE